MRPLRTFLWHNIMIHRTQRLCLIEKKKERDCKLARTFACQLRKHCTIFFQPGFQCLMCQAFLASWDRCSYIQVPVRVLSGGHAHPFIWQFFRFFPSQFSNPQHRLLWFIGDFCYPVSLLPPSWIVNMGLERESLGDKILKKNHTFSWYSTICT